MAKVEGLKVERTGQIYSMASSEFLATFPDGRSITIWSPPWHEYSKEEEAERAYEYAAKLWQQAQDGIDIWADEKDFWTDGKGA